MRADWTTAIMLEVQSKKPKIKEEKRNENPK